MSATLDRIRVLVAQEKVRVSDHGYDELAADQLLAAEVINGLAGAIVVEDYPKYPKGSCVLVLQQDSRRLPIHVLWGIPAGAAEPAVLITVYRPDAERWDESFLRRK